MTDVSPESYLVGCAAIDPRAYTVIANAGVRSEQFVIDQAKAFFKAMEVLTTTCSGTDLPTVMERMKRYGVDPNKNYILDCMDIVPSASFVEEYIRSFKREIRLRKVNEIADKIRTACLTGGDASEIIGSARLELERIQVEEEGTLLNSKEAFDDLNKNINERMDGRISYARTGFRKLDEILGGGMLNSGFYILAARPGMGKSTVSVALAENIAKDGGTVLYVTLEMSARQISARRISAASGVPSRKILMGSMFSAAEVEKIASAMDDLSDTGFVINKHPGISVADIGTIARSISDLRCIVVDHMGLVTPEDAKLPQYEKITRISNGLKQLAITLDVPILALCQLSRETEKRAGKRPELSDLRDSGAIEQDADAVMMLYSEEYYGDEEVKKRLEHQENPQHMEIIVRKNRHAGTGTVHTLAYMIVNRVVEDEY